MVTSSAAVEGVAGRAASERSSAAMARVMARKVFLIMVCPPIAQSAFGEEYGEVRGLSTRNLVRRLRIAGLHEYNWGLAGTQPSPPEQDPCSMALQEDR